jgi:hypothetical protein
VGAGRLPGRYTDALQTPRPRLFVTPERLGRLRALVRGRRGTHHRDAFDQLRARVAAGAGAYGTGKAGYRRSALAREAALAHLVTGDRSLAARAFDALVESEKDEDRPDSGYGLSRAMMCLGHALAYDWCHGAWTPEQRAHTLAVMRRAADAWPAYSHPNIETAHKGSNWVGVCRGGELLLHLAARGDGDYGDRTDRIRLCAADLRRHLATAYGPASGWTQEGIGYLQYTFGFLAPAALAARDTPGLEPLWDDFARIAWHRLALHALSFRAGHEMLQSGVGSERVYDEGYASLIAATVPPAERGAYRYWYDRHMGVKAARPTYDSDRAGTVWALLLYPDDARPADPAGIPALRGPLLDREKGVCFFRDRWRDADDVLVSLVWRADHHGNAWSQDETLQIGLMGLDSLWAAGPGKEREPALYSKILVDGAAKEPAQGKGRLLDFRPAPDGGGRVVADGAANLGLRRAVRDLTVAFPGRPDRRAVLRLRDTLEGDAPHAFTWQLHTGTGVTAEADEGARTFLLRRGDAWLKGWVTAAPAGSKIGAAPGALRVVAPSAREAEFAVTLQLGRGPVPTDEPPG